jgi:hypothetical protein
VYFTDALSFCNLIIPTGAPSDELDNTIQRKWLGENKEEEGEYIFE